jgi:hypothetical protein
MAVVAIAMLDGSGADHGVVDRNRTMFLAENLLKNPHSLVLSGQHYGADIPSALGRNCGGLRSFSATNLRVAVNKIPIGRQRAPAERAGGKPPTPPAQVTLARGRVACHIAAMALVCATSFPARSWRALLAVAPRWGAAHPHVFIDAGITLADADGSGSRSPRSR